MKTLLTIIALLASLNTFAGSLINEATGETVEFQMNRETRIVEVISTSSAVANFTLKLSQVKVSSDYVKTYGITDHVCREIWQQHNYVLECFIFPVFSIPGLVTGLVESLMLPVKLPLNIIQKSRNKKDFKILMSAIVSDEVTTISENRFRRIESLINRAKK